jgi:hypothetical protein
MEIEEVLAEEVVSADAETEVSSEAEAVVSEEVTEISDAQEAEVITATVSDPTPEALACDAPEARAKEAFDSFREAQFDGENVIRDVIPIRAGESKNRKFYPAEVLQRDLSVFNGMAVFYDHQPPKASKPLKSAIGVVENVRWDTSINAPRADIRYPRSMESTWQEIKDKFDLFGPERVGLSIDMNIKARLASNNGRIFHHVEALTGGRDASVDVVWMPAAGGRVWESVQEVDSEIMDLENLDIDTLRATRPDLVQALEGAREAVVVEPAASTTTVDVDAVINDRVAEAVQRATAKIAFEGRVREAKVPDRVKQTMLREAEAASFETQACESIFEEWCNIAAAQSGGAQVQMPAGSVRVTESVDVAKARLLGAALQEDQEVNGQRVRRFTSLREAILAFHPEMTHQMVYNPSQFARESIGLLHWGGGMLHDHMRAQESYTSASFTNSWADVMNKTLLAAIADPDLNTWRRWVSRIERFNDLSNTKKLIRIGEYPNIASVNEGQPYQAITGVTEEKVEFSISKYGNTEDFTWEAALRDDLGTLARIPRSLGRAWAWTIYDGVHTLLTTASGAGSTMDYDSKALYHTDHSNIATTAFTAADLITVEDKIRRQRALDSSKPKNYRPRFLLYAENASLRQSIWEALNAMFKVNPLSTSGSQVNLPNFIREQLGLEPIEVFYPDSSTTRWEIVADPRDSDTVAVGFLNGQETPDLFVQDMENVGSRFNADKITYKIRGTFGAEVIDHRAFSRGNV